MTSRNFARTRKPGLTAALGTLAALSLVSVWGTMGVAAARRQDAAQGALTAPLAVEWQFTSLPFPNNQARPVLADGTIYFASGNRIYAIDPETGAQKWRYPTDSVLTTPVQRAPVVSNGTVFFGGGDGIYALDAATGRQKYQRFNIPGGIVTTPVAINDVIYFGAAGGKIFAVDARTGNMAEGPFAQRGKRPGLAVPEIASDFAVAEDNLYFATSDQKLVSYSLTAGVQKWAASIGAPVPPGTVPVVNGEAVYLAAGPRYMSWRLSGQPRFNVQLPLDSMVSPVVDANGTSYMILGDRNVYAANIESSGRIRPLWQKPGHIEFEAVAQPLVSNGLLIVPTTLGALYAFDTKDGTLRWSYNLRPTSNNPNAVPSLVNVASTPLAAGDRLYVVGDDGSLTAFSNNAPDGLPPTADRLIPTPGDALNGRPPFQVRARITDPGSGLNLSTLEFRIDSQPIKKKPDDRNNAAIAAQSGWTYDARTGTLEYLVLENEGAGRSAGLPDGVHTATVTVQDWKGNPMVKSWTFTVDDSLPRRRRPDENGPAGGPGGRGPGGRNGGPGGLGGGRNNGDG